MKSHCMKHPAIISVTVSAALSGCATMTDQQTTVAQGSGVGALVGAGIGYAVTGRPSGALIGAAAGGLVGAGIGNSIAERKAQYANEEDFLVAEIQRNDQFIREAQSQNQAISTEIARLDRESAELAETYRLGKSSRSALAQQKAKLEKQLARAKRVNTLAEKQLADATAVYNQVRQKPNIQGQYARNLEQNVRGLQETQQQAAQNVADLEQSAGRLARVGA